MSNRWRLLRAVSAFFVLTLLQANSFNGSPVTRADTPSAAAQVSTSVNAAEQSILWATKANMPTARASFGLARAPDGKLYAIGGWSPGPTKNAVEVYDPQADSWGNRASMPTARLGLGVVAAQNGKLYAIGGWSGDYLATVEEYDPVANTWAGRASMSTRRDGPGVAAGTNGKIYAMGGYNGGYGGHLSSVEEYDPNSNTWTTKAPMPVARNGFAAVGTPDGRIFAIGGGNASAALTSVHVYYPATNAWTAVADLPTEQNVPLAAAVGGDGKIYVVGGVGGTTTVYRYDPSTNAWVTMTSLPELRQRVGAAFSTNNRLYVVGGCICDGQIFSSVFEGSFGPSSSMSTLSAYRPSAITVSWSGTPATNPITSYDIQYKDGSAGTWTDWLTGTTATSATFGPASPVAVTEGHTYYFQSRTRDSGGNVEAYPGGNGDTYTTVDATAPSGSLQVQGWSSPYNSNTVTISASATDATSGVSQMQIGTDGQTFSAWTAYTTTVSYPAPAGATAVYARFKDNAGNISQPVSATITLDAVPPAGTLQVQGWSSPYISNTVTLSVSATDATSGVSQMQFGADGQSFGAWESYATSSLYIAPPGATAVYARFKDNAGNISEPVSAAITLNATAPTGSVSINAGATYAAALSVTLTLAAADSNGTMSEMSLSNDGSSWSGWQGYATSKSWSLAGGADGLRAVYARFRDTAQNVSSVYSDTIVLDTTPPSGTVSINAGASDVGSTSVSLSLSASDALSGVSQMSLSNDGLAYSDWES